MAGDLTVNRVQLGDSTTAANNFVWQTNTDGTAKLARGNVGATTQDILTVDANGLITFSQGKQLTLGTAQNTTSGTSIDFTGIPSWVKRITVIFNGVSTNGTSTPQIQIGSGSIVTSGYVSGANAITNSVTGGTNFSSGFGFFNSAAAAAANTIYGHFVLTLISSNTWIASFVLNVNQTSWYQTQGGGVIALGGTLDRLRLTNANGTDTFDAGSVNIMYEG